MATTTRVRTTLNTTQLQEKHPELYQTLKQLMDVIDKLPTSVPVTQQPKFVGISTAAGPVTVRLSATVVGLTIIKDVTGNAAANNITLTGTVDGVVNPVINTNFGQMRVYPTGGTYHQW